MFFDSYTIPPDFALLQFPDTSSMSPISKPSKTIAFGCICIHLVCSSVRVSSMCSTCSNELLVVNINSPIIVSAIVEGGWNSIHIHCP